MIMKIFRKFKPNKRSVIERSILEGAKSFCDKKETIIIALDESSLTKESILSLSLGELLNDKYNIIHYVAKKSQNHKLFLKSCYLLIEADDYEGEMLHIGTVIDYLNKEYNCDLQLGGSDQWGNIIIGVDLVRKVSSNESFGLTTPLLTTASGTKMGKSIGGAVWLNEEQLSPYDYYQYWRNTEDADVIKFAKLYCEFSDQEIQLLEELADKNINEAKKKLAYVVTSLCHGAEKANTAQETAIAVFEKGQVGNDLPTITIEAIKFQSGISCLDLFLEAGLTKSKGESRRLVRGNGAKINDQQITDENLIVDSSSVLEGIIKLSAGKKKHALVKII